MAITINPKGDDFATNTMTHHALDIKIFFVCIYPFEGKKEKSISIFFVIEQTLLAHLSPHALHKVLGPAGPRRIIGVDFELIPQCVHLHRAYGKDLQKENI